MANKFIVKPKSSDRKDDKFVVMSLRIEKELQEKYDELAKQSDRSRNELMNMALRYAIENLEFIPEEEPEPDEVNALLEGRADRKKNGAISHHEIKWN